MSEQGQMQLHAFIAGRVQGVGFRYYVIEHAQNLDLRGWVRNLWDGRVEVVAEGPQADLERLLVFLQRGPSSARVEHVDVEWMVSTGEFTGFHPR
jgi:acylphosphatase